jgi:uncharacterized protein (TIGR02391 family)
VADDARPRGMESNPKFNGRTPDHSAGRANPQRWWGSTYRAERLGVALHQRIAQQVEEQFLLGQYDLAVFAALREVEIRVRELANAPESLLGVKLMQQAFSVNGPGPLLDTAADPGEQEAAMNLFRGAIGLFKNPTSHRAGSYDDPVIASDIILLADLLLRFLDQIVRRLKDEPAA